LKSFGWRGVPRYVVYPKDRSKGPVLLPEVLTPSIVMDAVER
jgi:thiol:disulfide interchange protein